MVSIDGRVLFALTGETPLYRELRRGDVGPDVRTMADFLAARGLLDSSQTDDKFGVNIERGVRAFQRSAGEAADGVFRPASTVFVPFVQGTVSELKTHVGAQVDSGSPLVTVRTRPTSISFALGGSENRLPTAPPGPVEFEVGANTVSLPTSIPSRGQFDAIVDALTAAVTEGTATASKGDGVSVTYVGATLSAPTPTVVGVVPSSSILPLADGGYCLLKRGSSGRPEAVKFTTARSIEGEIGQAAVPRDLVGRAFYVDPLALPDRSRELCR